ncbi:hypothetical protein CEXT_546001 [Caerostris extrusa]|uniref:Uncharacterized protein n=1 Tax=Caerostris extrusa TaxID=172846 RepID=A0AAV4MWP3_CAEEX|nr:hypothetical protein CEXT_546001 [Caerostris extrusa]
MKTVLKPVAYPRIVFRSFLPHKEETFSTGYFLYCIIPRKKRLFLSFLSHHCVVYADAQKPFFCYFLFLSSGASFCAIRTHRVSRNCA